MTKDGPYYDKRPYHMAKLISEDGDISPLFAAKTRKINLRRESWTIRLEAVTCKKCLKLLNRDAAIDRSKRKTAARI